MSTGDVSREALHEAPALYVDLIARLRSDAARACSAFFELKGKGSIPPADILVRNDFVGLWCACINRPGCIDYSGDSMTSEAEALCSLISRAERDVEAAGGVAPLHLLLQLEVDAERLAVYRKLTTFMIREGLGAMMGALDCLDAVGEASDLAYEQKALAALKGTARAKDPETRREL